VSFVRWAIKGDVQFCPPLLDLQIKKGLVLAKVNDK